MKMFLLATSALLLNQSAFAMGGPSFETFGDFLRITVSDISLDKCEIAFAEELAKYTKSKQIVSADTGCFGGTTAVNGDEEEMQAAGRIVVKREQLFSPPQNR